MKRSIYYFAIVLSFASLLLGAHAYASTGFVTSPLWLSPETPVEGQMATLSALFQNADTSPVTGTIIFYDGNTFLAKKTIIVPPNDVGTATATFLMTAGSHSFSATINTVTMQSNGGTAEPVNLPVSTVRLKDIFIPKKVGLSAQADGTAGTGEQPILNQIDSAEKKVLNAIPADTKNAISTIAKKVDSWRAAQADSFKAGVTDAKTTIAESSSDSKTAPVKGTTKNTTDTSSTSPIKGPLAYVKLFIFSVLSFLFSLSVIFYIVALIVAYIVIRFIFRKLARIIRGRKAGGKH